MRTPIVAGALIVTAAASFLAGWIVSDSCPLTETVEIRIPIPVSAHVSAEEREQLKAAFVQRFGELNPTLTEKA